MLCKVDGQGCVVNITYLHMTRKVLEAQLVHSCDNHGQDKGSFNLHLPAYNFELIKNMLRACGNSVYELNVISRLHKINVMINGKNNNDKISTFYVDSYVLRAISFSTQYWNIILSS